jgi:hypothetical protein
MHLVKAFTELQIKKILSKYILKRYSRDARSIVSWDRNDIVRGGPDGSEEETRFTKLAPLMMGIARASSKSDYRCDETWTRGTSLKELIETIPTNMVRAVRGQAAVLVQQGATLKKLVGLRLLFWNCQCHKPRDVEQGGMVTVVHQERSGRVQIHIRVSEPRVEWK